MTFRTMNFHSLFQPELRTSSVALNSLAALSLLLSFSIPLPVFASSTHTKTAKKKTVRITTAKTDAGKADAAKADAVKQTIQSLYDDQNTAIVGGDIDGAMIPYAEDGIFLNDLKGTESQGLAGVRRGWLGLMNMPRQKVTTATTTIKEITVNKAYNGATVLTLDHSDLAGTTKSGKAFITGIEMLTRHFWAKTDDGWRIKQERILSVDTFLNGKLIRHNHNPVAP